MKKFLIILLISFSCLTSCVSTNKNISTSDNQKIVSEIRSIYLNKAINSINNDIFNKLSLEDIISPDINNLKLVQNEVPFLKKNLVELDLNVHNSLRKATVEYQNILNKYSNQLEFPPAQPSENNFYFIEKPGINVLFEEYGDLINIEINEVMNNLFSTSIEEYTQIANNYNIYCESLKSLNRQTLSQTNTDIEATIKQLFLDTIYYTIITSEKSYMYEKNSFEPNKIKINN